jgi:putative membrane protein
MHTAKHARLAALALGACLTIGCGGDRAGDDTTTDTAGGAVANAPVTGGAGTGSMEATEPRNDSEIMSLVAQSNDAEVSSSQLALKNASNAQVKQFAQQMITDHTAMQKQGAQVGKALGTEGTGSDSTQAKHDMMHDQLGDLQDKKGADFDKAYMDMQVQAHQKTLEDLRSFQAKAQNGELKTMITNAIPKVEAHLQKAQQLQQTVQGAKS